MYPSEIKKTIYRQDYLRSSANKQIQVTCEVNKGCCSDEIKAKVDIKPTRLELHPSREQTTNNIIVAMFIHTQLHERRKVHRQNGQQFSNNTSHFSESTHSSQCTQSPRKPKRTSIVKAFGQSSKYAPVGNWRSAFA